MSLTKEQLQIIDDLFESGGDESAVLQKHKIPRKLWSDWLSDKDFADEIAARTDASKRHSQIILSKYAPFAAAKLVQLCESENQETSRKAVLDILNLQAGRKTQDLPQPELPSLDAQTASKLLAALAEEKS
jgi:hypothetical protein